MNRVALRGLAHLLVGSVCASFIWLAPHWAAVAFLAVAAGFFLLLDAARLKNYRVYNYFLFLFRPFLRETEQKRLSGAFYLTAGCLITALIFSRPLAGTAVLFLTFGDLSATLIGSLKGRIKLWGKSLEGSLACLIVCALIAFIASLNNVAMAPLTLSMGVLSATVLEALPWGINDNLSLPIGSAAIMLAVGKLIS
jgi:acyl phosphate:glycerol-3-phosphate acyltransferase